jgi:hypothetical protein
MATTITIESPYSERELFLEKLHWLKSRLPSKEYIINTYFEQDEDEIIIALSAEVVIWSDDAERVAIEYWLYN